MLEVQKYLISNSLISLQNEFSIKVVEHPTLPLIILNYDQLLSPRKIQIVDDCRCLILNKNTFELISRSFNRFYNFHELNKEEQEKFDWQNYVQIAEKVDGSLVNVFYYKDSWRVTTRQSWATSYVNSTSKKWDELIFEAFPLSDMEKVLDKNLSYAFELTSPYSKVVRYHPSTSLYLLTIFNKEQECRDIFCNASVEIWKHLAPNIQVNRPENYSFDSFQEVQDWLNTHGNDDPTFEGFVLRDCNNYRVKAKSTAYWALSRLKGEGNNLFNPRYIIPLVIDGEVPEALSYFSEATDAFNEVREKLEYHKDKLLTLWDRTKHIQDQKIFAQSVLTETPFNGILFKARKEKREPGDIWRESSDMIYNTLFKNKKNVSIS